jgi:hypothetical protein
MSTNTYVALDTQTLSSATASVTFSSIPQTYTDLVLVCNLINSSATNTYWGIQPNGISTSTYGDTYLYGNGTSAVSARDTNVSAIYWNYVNTHLARTNPITCIAHIMNYANTTTKKTALMRMGSAATSTNLVAGVTAATSAITSLVVVSQSNNWAVGSTFTLYGIAAQVGGSTPKALGGTITSDATYWYHTFTNSGMFVPNQTVSADVLVVAGGGGGGSTTDATSGGGGAGGLCYQTSRSIVAGSYLAMIGGGGAGVSNASGTQGSNTVFDTITALGGGYGGGATYGTGSSGGSGGGAGNAAGGSATQANSGGATGLGYAGGTGYAKRGAGGGGAGGVGIGNTTTSYGGVGYYSTLTDAMGAATTTGQLVSGHYYYAGGGGAGCEFASGGPTGESLGGYGGGGNGEQYTEGQATAGTVSTGGGGGGCMPTGTATPGKAGGSGIVIIRYVK